MGYLLPQYRKSIYENMFNLVDTNTANYYAFSSHPIPYTGNTPAVTHDDYSTTFINDWQMLFGKRLGINNIMPMIKLIPWANGVVYERYDDRNANLYNTRYYCVVPPGSEGAPHYIYKCIDNNSGGPSTQRPDQVDQASTFTKSDGYSWRYMASVPDIDFQYFGTNDFIPIIPDPTIVSGAYNYSGVDVVNVESPGAGYSSYSQTKDLNTLQLIGISGSFNRGDLVQQSNGTTSIYGYVYTSNATAVSLILKDRATEFIATANSSTILYDTVTGATANVLSIVASGMNYIQSVVNSTLIQIESYEPTDTNFFTNNAIYIYSNRTATAELKVVSRYVSNTSGSWITLDSPANTENITELVTQYVIAPQVVFESDGDSPPRGYCVVNTQSNTIQSVIVVDPGYGVSWANATVVSNSSFGNNAVIRPIAPPHGGHGSDPISELNIKAIGFGFEFSNTEYGSIPEEITKYNKIGIIKDPYTLNEYGLKGPALIQNTYIACLRATVSPEYVFTEGSEVCGNTTGAHGTVVYSNGSYLLLTGDKTFSNSEYIKGTPAQIIINTLGDIYTKDLQPLYVQNIDNIERANDQTESYKLIIEI